jgi:hypothetical protein
MPHQHAKDLMNAFFSRDEKYSSDLKLFGEVWTEFISSWFGLPLQDSPSKYIHYASDVMITPGQRWGNFIFGDGQILSVADRPSLRYLVKFSFGVGYVHPDAIYCAIPLIVPLITSASDADMDMSTEDVAYANHLMSDDIQVLFGTEKIYLFMRLYVLLVTMLYQAKDIADRKGAGADESGPFVGVVSSLKELLRGKIGSKAFQEDCTKNMDNDVYIFVAIPPLVEKCAAALVNMAKEGYLEDLYQCSQLKLKV